MISKKALKSVRRQRLIEAVALLNNADYIHTQLNLVVRFSEVALNKSKEVVSKCFTSMGKWGETNKGKEGFVGAMADIFAPLRESGEKLDAKTIDLLAGILTRHEEEKKRLDSLSDEGLADMFLHSAARIVKFGGDVAGDELAGKTLEAMVKLYDVKAPGADPETLEEDVAVKFLKELLIAARRKLKQSHNEEAAHEHFQYLLSQLNETEVAAMEKSLDVEVASFENFRAALVAEEPDLSAVHGKGFGLYLGISMLLESYAFTSRTVYPMAGGVQLWTLLSFFLIPLLGWFISIGVFGILEWREYERFNLKLLAYTVIPLYLESLPRTAHRPKPKPKTKPAITAG